MHELDVHCLGCSREKRIGMDVALGGFFFSVRNTECIIHIYGMCLPLLPRAGRAKGAAV